MSTNSIDKALEDLATIRLSLANAETFRGYRSATVLASSLFAFVGCYLHYRWIDPLAPNLDLFLAIWIRVAVVSAAVTLGEVIVRYWQSGPVLRRLTRSATAPMVPSLGAGIMLTACFVRSAPYAGWMLPGLWSMLFGLGIFASAKYLPKAILIAAVYFLVMGAMCIWIGPADSSIAPWLMGITFGVGQLISSAILYWTLERKQ